MIIYRQATTRDRDEISDLLINHFYPYEPMNLGWITKGDIREEDIELSLEDLDDEFCILAIDDEKGKIVGASLNAVDKYENIDEMYKESEKTKNPKWAEYLRFYADCDRDAEIFKKYQTETSFHVHCLVVHSDYRGMSIGFNLISKTHQLGAKLGHKISTVNCSSSITEKIALKLNMELVYEIAYDDYKGKNGQKVMKSSPCHTHLRTYAKIINISS